MIVRRHALLNRASILCLLLLALGLPVAAQESPLQIKYWLGMPNPGSHLFEVTIEVTLPNEGISSLDFQMAKWSPGRYAVFDFAKNVQEVTAREACPAGLDCTLPKLEVTRVDNQTWHVPLGNFRPAGMSLMFTYKVFGNDLSGTFSQLDSRHANFNGGCVFMYVLNHKQDPVSLSIKTPKDWHVINGATERKDQDEFQFPNWDIMIDTPTEISPNWTEDDFKIDGKTYRVVVHSLGNEGGKRPLLVKEIERIVKAETAMWGPPEFDTYTFLIHFANDARSSDGMEHLNSTQVIMPGTLGEAGMLEETLDGVAHEFFHVWNVKRLRPIELGPWDFTRPAFTPGLWIAEGITNYYGHLMQRRAGLWDDAKLFGALAQQITEVENAPGSRLMSAEESSQVASFIDDAPHAQQTNLANTSISYYSKGEVVGMVLDLLIRGKTKGKASLDEVMRRMYEKFYLRSPNATYYLRGRGYRDEDFEQVTSEVAGSDMSDFFKRYVRGVEPPPYEAAFAQVGLRFVREPRATATFGVSADYSSDTVFKIGQVLPDSPAAKAGLEVGDTIISLGGIRVTPMNFAKTVGRFKPGDRVTVTLQRGSRTMQVSMTLSAPQLMDYRLEELSIASAEAKSLRAAWLNGK